MWKKLGDAKLFLSSIFHNLLFIYLTFDVSFTDISALKNKINKDD